MSLIPILIACTMGLAAGVGVIGNEVTHGAWSESMGLGHHHLADYGGYHCAAHESQAHMQHMHNGTFTDHQHCPGGVHMHGDGHRHNHGGMHDA
ncbi:MAG: hypothetical protein WC876_01320 [Candidatus Thermoplasmatota archaeon]